MCIKFCELEALVGEVFGRGGEGGILCNVASHILPSHSRSEKKNCPSVRGAPRWLASMLLGKSCEYLEALGTSDLKTEHTATTGVKKSTDNATEAGIHGPEPRGSEFWRRSEVDYFQARHRCQTEEGGRERIVVKPRRRRANPSRGGYLT